MPTPKEILDGVRHLTQDRDDTGYRQANDELLAYLKEGVALAMMVRPDLFGSDYEHTCIAGAHQVIPSDKSQKLLEVRRVKNGSALTKMSKAALDQFDPSWITASADVALQWDFDPAGLSSFWVYPPSTADQLLVTRVIPQPQTYTTSNWEQDMGLPDWMRVPLVSYVTGRSEFKDDESVNSGRAAAMTAQFTDTIKAGA